MRPSFLRLLQGLCADTAPPDDSSFSITDMSTYSRTLQRSGPVNVAVWVHPPLLGLPSIPFPPSVFSLPLTLIASQVNEGDNSAIKSEYGAGGGGYSAYGDASCRDANPGAVFPNPTTGAECRWYVSGGGSGASNKLAGVPDNTQGTKGNSVSKSVDLFLFLDSDL